MLWLVTARLLGLPNSFPALASAALSGWRSAAADPAVRSKDRKKKYYTDVEGMFKEGVYSVTIKMSVRSL